MAIIEKEVFIPINQRNIGYYKKLNYENVEIGKSLKVKVEHLSKSSRAKLTKKCDNPNCDIAGGRIIENQTYQRILKCRENNEFGYDLCKNCARVFSWKTRKQYIPYEKTLEYFAITNKKEYLLNEFSSKNKKKPNEISLSTLDKYLWDCPKCQSEYSVTVSTRTNNDSACPFCHGKAVNHTNCLWTTHPKIAKLLADPNDGFKHTKGTHTKVKFKCPDCGFIVKNKSIANTILRGLSCPRCSDGYSYPEKFMFNILNQLQVEFNFQKKFNWSENKKYDFYIPSLNCIIETHGEQHYRYTGFNRTLKDEQNNDILKEKLAKENGVENYIIIDCRYSELEYIKNNILTSDLSSLLNLSKIKWLECNEYACKSFLKDACRLFKQGKSVSEIMSILNLSKFPVLKYLKIGTKLNWCNYDPKEEVKRSNRKHRNSSKPVVLLSIDGDYIQEYPSAAEASRKLNIGSNSISLVCNRKKESVKDFKFMFKNDYEKKVQGELND